MEKKLYLIQFKLGDSLIFNERVKSLGSWLKYFEDNWIVSSQLTSEEIYNKITEGYENTSIFIIELNSNNYYGRMNTKVWDYFRDNKPKNKK